jgi:hypothetical protein
MIKVDLGGGCIELHEFAEKNGYWGLLMLHRTVYLFEFINPDLFPLRHMQAIYFTV